MVSETLTKLRALLPIEGLPKLTCENKILVTGDGLGHAAMEPKDLLNK